MMDQSPEVLAYINESIKPTVLQTQRYVLGVDVGGTNVRIAIGALGGQYVIISKFQSSSLKQLLDALEQLSTPLISLMGVNPYAACIDIAGPVTDQGTKVEVTNYVGTTEERTISTTDLPPALFPAGRTLFINDLESCCYGILGLEEQEKLDEFFKPLWSGKVPAPTNPIKLAPLHYAVIAAGTGLGVGLLLKLGNKRVQVYPLEFGHVTIPPVGKSHKHRDLDIKLLDYLGQRLYGGAHSPEYEDISSGRGLEYVYDFLVKDLSDTPGGLSAAEIAVAASSGNPNALKAVEIHYRLLLRCAQNVAVGLNVKGIFLAGDNQAFNHAIVNSLQPVLHEEFLNHPKRHWIENVPVYSQTTTFNINLYGTLYVARLLVTQ